MQIGSDLHSSQGYNEPLTLVSEEIKKTEEPSQPKEEPWKEDYDKLLALQTKRGIHPLKEDNPDVLNNVVDLFLDCFLKAPEDIKPSLATSPLFPEQIKFTGFEQKIETAKPLNYACFTARKDLLDALSPYLKDADWLVLGPYKSTFLHCVISGLEKNCSSRGRPKDVAKYLISRFPELKTKRNELGSTPLQYIHTVLPALERGLSMIKTHGHGSLGNLDPLSTFKDICGGRYNQTASDFEIMICEAKEIIKLL